MPSKPYTVRTKRTGRYKRKHRTALYMQRRGYVIGGFPKSTTVKLRYVETVNMDAGSGVFALKLFSANGMYDPNLSDSGHQPSNFDTWMSQYDHYTVQSSRISAQFIPTATTTVTPGALGILMSDGGSSVAALGSLDAILEQPYNKRANQFPTGVTVSNPLPKVSRSFNAARFFGKSKAVILGDDAYRGSSLLNPSDGCFFELYQYSLNGNNPGAITVIVTIEYLAVFSERRVTISS